MDKWTKSVLKHGYPRDYSSVKAMLGDFNKLEDWAEKRSDGMFGPIFGVLQSKVMLKKKPPFVNLPEDQLEEYQKICAAAHVTNDHEIATYYLVYRDWGYSRLEWNDMKKLIKKELWYGTKEEWDRDMAISQLIDLKPFASLDEPSKLLIGVAAKQGGKIATKDLTNRSFESLKFFRKPTLNECVQYALDDMRSADIALFLKSIGQIQKGTKDERIKRVLQSLPLDELANKLEITQESYLHILDDPKDRGVLCDTTFFLYDLSKAVLSLFISQLPIKFYS